MVILSKANEQFSIRGFQITVMPDYILRLPTMTVICIDQSMLKDHHKAVIEWICEHDMYGVDDEQMYVVIPDDHKPFICMFPSDLISDEDLQSDIERMAAHDNITEYCRIGY